MGRNSLGVYTLSQPAVQSGTVIRSENENATRTDFATEITDSLSRSGKGGMLAPLGLATGSSANPSLAFLSDMGTGFWRPAPNTLEVVANNAPLFRWTPTLLSTAVAIQAGGGLDVEGAFNATDDSTFGGNVAASSFSTTGTVTGQALVATGGSNAVQVKAGTVDSAFVYYYPRTSVPGAVGGYVGFGAGSNNFDFVNAFAGGAVRLFPGTGGGIQGVTTGGGNIAFSAGGTGSMAFSTAGVGGISVTSGGGQVLVDASASGASVQIKGAGGSVVSIDVAGNMTLTSGGATTLTASGNLALTASGNVAVNAGASGSTTFNTYLRTTSTGIAVTDPSGSPFTASGTPTCIKSADGDVTAYGGFVCVGGGTTSFVTFPPGFRPPTTIRTWVLSKAGAGSLTSTTALVNTDGTVVLTGNSVSGTTYYIDDIRFPSA